MAGPGSGGPFYFAYCDEGDAFDSAMYRYDVPIFSFRLSAKEGQIPSLDVEIKNPWIDAPSFKLIGPGRQKWAWFAWWDGTAVRPLFHGRIVGAPASIAGETVTLQFIARRSDWIAQKQALADTLKVAPFYDPIFLSDDKRGDPDAILEAYAAAFHVDPVTGEWSVSDLLEGEDGVEVFGETDVLFDGAKTDLRGIPEVAVNYQISATWSQVMSGGSILAGAWNIRSFGGGALLSEWPKAGASLGGGWYVQAAGAVDMRGIDRASMVTISGGFQDQAPRHNDGDAISGQGSQSMPDCLVGDSVSFVVSESGKGAIIGDDYADPSANWSAQVALIPAYDVSAYLWLKYEANRKRVELLSFTMAADVQPIAVDATIAQETETISLSTVDLSKPLLEWKASTSLRGQPVALGQICLPNNPSGPGQVAFQICVVAGVCGVVEPAFSNNSGFATDDGSARWACIGATLPEPGDWRPGADVALGTILAPIPERYIDYGALLPPVFPFRASGASVSAGTVIRDELGGSFQYALTDGETGYLGRPAFSPIYGAPAVDGSVIWISLGMYLPGGTFQLCTTAGRTNALLRPPFANTPGAAVADGTAVFVSLGAGGPSISLPIGGAPGATTARSFFPTTRGRRALDHVALRARARLRARSRAAETTWISPFRVAPRLSLRKSATMTCPTLPGGGVTGKMIAYELTGDGATGEFLATVTVGSAVGNGGAATGTAGVGVYVSTDYVGGDYQALSGETAVGPTEDISYSPPIDAPNDDGLTFPLTREQVILGGGLVGNYALQKSILQANLSRIKRSMAPPEMDFGDAAIQALAKSRAAIGQGSASLDQVLALPGAKIYVELYLRPVTGQSFANVYDVPMQPLKIPKLIDLAA